MRQLEEERDRVQEALDSNKDKCRRLREQLEEAEHHLGGNVNALEEALGAINGQMVQLRAQVHHMIPDIRAFQKL